MNIPGGVTRVILGLLLLERQALAATPSQSKPALPPEITHQVLPQDTLRAGQDIELRKVQAMLSRQGPPQGKKTEPLR